MFRHTSSIAALAISALAACLSSVAHADLIKQSATYTKTVLVTDSNGNNVTGLTTSSFTATASKAGGVAASISTPTVTEIGSGKYSLAYPSSLTNTIGPLDVTLVASGAVQTDAHDQVVGFDPTSDLGAAALATNASAVAALPASTWGYTTRALTTLGSSAPSWYTAPSGGGSDPWATALPGSYGSGTAGALLGALSPAGIASTTLAAFKSDSLFAKLLNHVKGSFTYNESTKVMSLLGDDGTALGSVTLTIGSDGVITARQ